MIQVRDCVSGELTLTIRDDGTVGCYQPEEGVPDGPRFHIAASADGGRLLIVGQMQISNLATGELVFDLHEAVFDGLRAAGSRPDDQFEGRAEAVRCRSMVHSHRMDDGSSSAGRWSGPTVLR